MHDLELMNVAQLYMYEYMESLSVFFVCLGLQFYILSSCLTKNKEIALMMIIEVPKRKSV